MNEETSDRKVKHRDFKQLLSSVAHQAVQGSSNRRPNNMSFGSHTDRILPEVNIRDLNDTPVSQNRQCKTAKLGLFRTI